MKKIIILNFIFLIFGSTITISCQNTNPLTQYDAIRQAEQYIIDNGYTDKPADKAKIRYEFLYDDYVNNVDSLLKRRYNTLHSKAFCISEEPDSWHIGFLSSTVDLSKLSEAQRNSDLLGRAVIITKLDRKIKMAHKEPLFSYFKKL